jgi:hypothetical protein
MRNEIVQERESLKLRIVRTDWFASMDALRKDCGDWITPSPFLHFAIVDRPAEAERFRALVFPVSPRADIADAEKAERFYV